MVIDSVPWYNAGVRGKVAQHLYMITTASKNKSTVILGIHWFQWFSYVTFTGVQVNSMKKYMSGTPF